MEREQSAEAKALLYQPGSYPNCETNNNPQIYENIETYIAGKTLMTRRVVMVSLLVNLIFTDKLTVDI